MDSAYVGSAVRQLYPIADYTVVNALLFLFSPDCSSVIVSVVQTRINLLDIAYRYGAAALTLQSRSDGESLLLLFLYFTTGLHSFAERKKERVYNGMTEPWLPRESHGSCRSSSHAVGCVL